MLVAAVPVFGEKGLGFKDKELWKVKVSSDEEVLWYRLIARKEEGKPARGIIYSRHEDTEAEKGLYIEVTYLHIDDDYVWFAGKCFEDSDMEKQGRWLFMVVHDGGEPGKLVDHLWCEWLVDTKDAAAIAKRKVENLAKPKHNRLIMNGEIVVTAYKEIQLK